MSNFENAHNFKIESLAIHNYSSSSKNALECELSSSLVSAAFPNSPCIDLYDHSALGALHNSAERCDAPKCHEETRVAVQEEIFSWITHGERDALPKRVLWMSGPAGTGKTAIAGTVAETCKVKGLLAATFFFSSFSGSTERRSKRFLVTTIAYQLLQHDAFQDVGRRILAAAEKNPGIFLVRLKDQMEELILKPIREYRQEGGDISGWPQVIIIDGVDEVVSDLHEPQSKSTIHTAKEDTHREILSTLLQAALDPAFPFRILIVSRPERVIRNFFANEAQHVTRNIFLDDKYDPDADIALFLRSKFTEIRRRYNLPSSWPSDETIRKLVDNASGQFIYAATVLRFVQDPVQLPQAQLECVMSLKPSGNASNPFGPLDALYTRIMSGCPNPKLAICWLEAMRWGPVFAPWVILEAIP
ncbi:hypothetical protein NMY22_g17765 [Coprinellus aureogranulatus]|nr:hypothetical protein NMY22_g17765 [Coprinellus aureogranulatus]